MAITTYTPSSGAAPIPYVGVDLDDPADYADTSPKRVDAKFVLWPMMCTLLRMQNQIAALGAGEFFTKDADFTIPDSVVPNSTYFCTDAAGPVAPVLTLPKAGNCQPGTILNFIAASVLEGGTQGLVLIPNATVPDWIQYGDVGVTTSVAITSGNTVQIQLSDAGDFWYVTTPTLNKIDGTTIYSPKTKLSTTHFVRGSSNIAIPSVGGPLAVADFPANVIETAAINALAVTTAKIDNLAVTNAKIANTTIDLTAKVTGLLPVANQGYVLTDVTPPYSILSTDRVISNRAGAGAITLPSTAGIQGKIYTICNNSGVSCTLAPQGGQSIGLLGVGVSMTLDDQTFVSVCADAANTNWVIVG